MNWMAITQIIVIIQELVKVDAATANTNYDRSKINAVNSCL